MNKDLITSIGVAIIGTIGAYFVCNIFIGDISPESVETIDNSITADLAVPDEEVFNYKALNPTVEVFIGECEQYDEYGNCYDPDASIYDYVNTVDEEDNNEIEDNDEEEPVTDNTEKSSSNKAKAINYRRSSLNNSEND